MQKFHSQKSLKNFYIRPTTGVGSKGVFSSEKRENNTNRESKSINNFMVSNNNDNNNVLLMVNSYGLKPTTANLNTENNKQQIKTKIEAQINKRQTYPNSEYSLKNNIPEDFRMLNQKVFSGPANFSSNNLKKNIQNQENFINSNVLAKVQLLQLNNEFKQNNQQQIKDQKHFSDQNRGNKVNSQQEYPQGMSPRSVYLNVQRNNQQPLKNLQDQNVEFKNEFLEKQQKSKQMQEKLEDPFDNKSNVEKQDEEDFEQDQLSEIREKENNNDSFNDIQELATSGFDLTIFKEEQKQYNSPLQNKKHSIGKPPQIPLNTEKYQLSKGRFPLDSHENSVTNYSDVKRLSNLQKNISSNQYNFTQSKSQEQKDETIPSIHQKATSLQTLYGNTKENIQFINLKDENQENMTSRPITSQNNAQQQFESIILFY